MNIQEQRYLDLLKKILDNGEIRSDRTGVGTTSLFGERIEFDISESFPLLTTKKVHFKSVLYELLWLLSGDTNIKFMKDNNVTIWDEWADENGNLGPVYGKQWRSWDNKIDQIKNAIDLINNDPTSRRIIVNSWNVSDLHNMALPPCHMTFQFYVSNSNKLSCHMYQRSSDALLGAPFNISSYALLTYIISNITNKKPGNLIISFGDIHIYNNHIEQVKTQIQREPYEFPKLNITEKLSIDSISPRSIELVGYRHHPAIKAPIAV